MKALMFRWNGRFVRFMVAGGIAAAANYGSRFIFNIWFDYEISIVLAYIVGMAVAFILMRAYVFDAGGRPWAPQAVKFTLVNVLAVLQTLIVSVALDRWILPSLAVPGNHEAIAHLIGVLVPIGTSYFGHKVATFK
uniref:GtrA family protein n=1 Tax=Bordetella sputigena TaxID=1416810 RepID=UPI0039EE75ED